MAKQNRPHNWSGERSYRIWKIIIAGMMVSLITLNCNMPIEYFESRSSNAVSDDLVALGLDEMEISVKGNQVIMEYLGSADDSPQVMITGWLVALKTAFSEVPDAEEIVLKTYFEGEPYLEIKATAEDLRALSRKEIDEEILLDRLLFTDRRPTETRVFNTLLDLGFDVIKVDQFSDTLQVVYYPELAASTTELMDQWWTIFATLGEQELSVEDIQIRAVMPDTSVFVVEGNEEGLKAFTSGDITAIEYLASLEITEEPVVLEGE